MKLPVGWEGSECMKIPRVPTTRLGWKRRMTTCFFLRAFLSLQLLENWPGPHFSEFLVGTTVHESSTFNAYEFSRRLFLPYAARPLSTVSKSESFGQRESSESFPLPDSRVPLPRTSTNQEEGTNSSYQGATPTDDKDEKNREFPREKKNKQTNKRRRRSCMSRESTQAVLLSRY
jgi:hypothetical protein